MILKYRPEIDGLRAIAVISVILYHAQFQLFSGGFIGVDIFFVISGYLISSIILKEISDSGKFSFSKFYERRARRILPALFIVMLFTIPWGLRFIYPSNLLDFGYSILSSIGFASNFYFHYSGLEYEAENSLLIPFLHTWSLSVEEQFYIIFPPLVILCFKFLKSYLLHIIIGGILISLLFASWASVHYPSFSFYMLPTRGWELLAGAFLAHLEIINKKKLSNKKIIQFMPMIGLILIFYSIFFFHDNILHPSFLTLIPVIGVSLIIWFANQEEIFTKFLSSKIMVGTGLISYSLYLWHYPIFAIARLDGYGKNNYSEIIILFLAVLFLSLATYFLIERPFRKKSIFSIKIVAILLSGLCVITLILINTFIFQQRDLRGGFSDVFSRKNNFFSKPGLLLKDEKGECYDEDRRTDFCVFNKKSNKNAFIIGDSIVGALIFDLKDKLVNEGYRYTPIITGGCPYLPEFNRFDNQLTDKYNSFCNADFNNKIRDLVNNSNDSLVILGSRWPLYLSNKRFDNFEGGFEDRPYELRFEHEKNKISLKEGFKKSIQDLLKNDNTVILIYPIPEAGWHIPKKLYKIWKDDAFFKLFNNNENFLDKITNEPITTNFSIYKERTQETFRLFDSLSHPKLYKIYPHKIFCDNFIKDRCITHNSETVYYYDDNHLSEAGGALVNDLLMEKINIITKKNDH
tara:strand:- start:37 stop:2103 length:2067 start_codon:yes stop_codon:yes gene_type:complete